MKKETEKPAQLIGKDDMLQSPERSKVFTEWMDSLNSKTVKRIVVYEPMAISARKSGK